MERPLRPHQPETVSTAVAALLDDFHERRPVRAWSLIITLYGDAIVPRGGSLWLGSLSDIMALFRIDAGHVRTAMSRLTADGWLERERIGRNSYYRLTRREEGSFITATQRIYFAHAPAFDGRLRLALLGPGVDDRSAIRPALERSGFTALTPTTYVAYTDPSPPLPETEGLFLVHADPADDMHALAEAAWKLGPLAASYRAFISRFTPLDEALARGRPVPDADALIARTLLIHEFRRIVLRDPGLPDALLPPDWPGAAARALAGRVYRRLIEASEHFLDAHAQDQNGPIPTPQEGLSRRFAAN
ncbi:hypothetical protein MXD81_43895 [Microbacteriaceae bacterium K1510]|nr:hypothetical protein [Microbacteriaceae bacterium K1510]